MTNNKFAGIVPSSITTLTMQVSVALSARKVTLTVVDLPEGLDLRDVYRKVQVAGMKLIALNPQTLEATVLGKSSVYVAVGRLKDHFRQQILRYLKVLGLSPEIEFKITRAGH